MKEEYIRLSTEKNLFENLKFIIFLFENNYEQKWFWSIIALDQAIYTFCIGVLLNGNPDNVKMSGHDKDGKFIFGRDSNDHFKQKIHYVFNKKLPPYIISWEPTNEEVKNSHGNMLIGFWTAMARVQDFQFWRYIEPYRKVEFSIEEWKSLLEIHLNYRNDLVHFDPKLSSIPVTEVKKNLEIISLLLKKLIEKFGYLLVLNLDCFDGKYVKGKDDYTELKKLINKVVKHFS